MTIYSKDVIFREFTGTSKIEEIKRQKELGKQDFEMNEKNLDLYESTESNKEVEKQTSIIKRYS